MARRSDHSSQQITDMTVSWVQTYLSERSAENLSLRQVAKAIGYSPGTLINHFGSYGMLLLHVNASTLDQLDNAMAQGNVIGRDPGALIINMAKSYLAFAEAHTHAWRLVFEHRLSEHEDIPEWQMKRIDRLFTQLKELLKRVNQAASETELEQNARILWGSVHGITVLAVDDKLFSPVDTPNEQMVEKLITHYLSGWCTGSSQKQQGETL